MGWGSHPTRMLLREDRMGWGSHPTRMLLSTISTIKVALVIASTSPSKKTECGRGMTRQGLRQSLYIILNFFGAMD